MLDISSEAVTTAANISPVIRTKGNVRDEVVTWELVRKFVDGDEYLLDEKTGLIYKLSAANGQPVLQGKLENGKFEVGRKPLK